MGKGQKESTKRAGLLLRALECIDRDAYDSFQKYLIFGGTLDDLLWDVDHPGRREEGDSLKQVTALGEAMGEVHAELTARWGRSSAMHRTSVDSPSEEKRALRGLERLKGLGMTGMANEFQRLVDASYTTQESADDDHEWNILEAHYAKEVLRKLPKIVRRAAPLELLARSAKVPEEVRGYFSEAHRCYLYGFSIACAVLCRAILESSLVSEIDPKGTIKRKLQLKDSYVEKLVEEAQRRKILTDDRPEWALRIRDAGNYAIHDLPKFKREWGERLDQIILNTRKVFLDLYK